MEQLSLQPASGTPRRLPALREQRQHGTAAFPCSMYIADERREPAGTPFNCRLHWQDEIEIVHFEKGTFDISVNTDHFTIGREAFCFVGSGRLHAYQCPAGYLEQALLFSPAILASEDTSAAQVDLIGPLQEGLLQFPLLLTGESPAFRPLREEYRRLAQVFENAGERRRDQYNASDPVSQLRIKAGILNILAILAGNHLLRTADDSEDPRIRDLKKVMTYIRSGYTGKIYIRELAAIMNMNEQYFCRFFRKATGKTPIAYVNDLRIRQARRLLTGTSDSIMQICSACGFGNMSHFIEEFKRTTGMTPSQYRKQYRQLREEENEEGAAKED